MNLHSICKAKSLQMGTSKTVIIVAAVVESGYGSKQLQRLNSLRYRYDKLLIFKNYFHVAKHQNYLSAFAAA